MENDMGCKSLDAYRNLEVFYNQGDVIATIDNIKTGWEIEEKTSKEQKIPKTAVWKFPTNSVTFDLMRETNHGATASGSNQSDKSLPGCDGFVYQLKADSTKSSSEGHKARLSVRPKEGKCSLPTVFPDTKRPVEDTCRICHKNPPSNDGICTTCRVKLKEALTKNTGKETDGGFGGLSKKTVMELLRLLKDESDGRCNWIRLAEEIFGLGTKLIDSLRRGMANPVIEVLKLYFSCKREDGVPNQDAVGSLLEVFNRLDMKEAVQIVQAEQNTQLADEKLFWQLAEKLGPEWEKLAAFLKISSDEVYRIKRNNVEQVEKQIVTMLVLWRKRCVVNGNDWKCKLAEQLEEVKLPALAEFVIDYAPSPEVKDSANKEQFNSCKEAQQDG
ncbi:uncharacterized protein LOC119735163 [Patiria miniata]|uniref:Death domain-containing protein n=1 Tax=Patiria miniata TaxID=46514 RepID=A0A914AMQ3_PATMI|nr:uncharacterized protein LOC119735163 [Patiria miniata]